MLLSFPPLTSHRGVETSGLHNGCQSCKQPLAETRCASVAHGGLTLRLLGSLDCCAPVKHYEAVSVTVHFASSTTTELKIQVSDRLMAALFSVQMFKFLNGRDLEVVVCPVISYIIMHYC